MGRFDGRSVLVTGTASGIGQATALRFGADGGVVTCADIDGDGAEKTAGMVRERGGNAIAIHCDVSDEASAGAAVARAVEHGGGKLNVLANVAGIGHFRHTTEETKAGWDRIIGVNLTGVFLMTHAALPHLLESRGNVVNVASVSGMKGQPYSAAYCASKGGVVMLTRALAVEYARKGVRINAVSPGGVQTNIIAGFMPPENAEWDLITRMSVIPDFMDPSEIANAVTFLASDEAAYCHGTVLVVDGGMIA
jgi:NAD(P)-dependent dehydrogenase (short-subunit alcohol dehydrogenase family)